MTLTALQTDIAWGDVHHNLDVAERLIAAAGTSDLYVLPEMFATGFATQPQEIAESEDGTILRWMRDMAHRKDAALAGSVAVQAADGTYRNRLYFVTPDGTTTYYDKHHLFTYADEHLTYTAGDAPVIVTWRGVRIMLQICYDLRFPCFSRNRAVPYDLCLYVASWPASRRIAWDTLLRARAIENQCYIAGINRIGDDPSCHYNGGTAIIDPYGNPILTAPDDEEATLSHTLDLPRLHRFREKFPVLRDAD
ncbi:MAG: amidohydrolase [Prevotella sp.]|nr:amidohydrolase [Prevotella sp.]